MNIHHSIFSRLALILVALLALASCSESDDTTEEFANWQEKNSTEWNTIYSQAQQRIAQGDTSWKIIHAYNLPETDNASNTDYIVVHVNKAGTGSGTPLYTDRCASTTRAISFPRPAIPPWATSSTRRGEMPPQRPLPCPRSSQSAHWTTGFATALQHMHIGDDWDVYVPWTLGYARRQTSSIPAFSVLIFNIQLVSYFPRQRHVARQL